MKKISKTSSNSIGNVVLDDYCLQPKDSQLNDKKIFICSICSATNSIYHYFVLAEDTEDAKRIITKHGASMSNNIHCRDIEDIKKCMIKENNKIKFYC